MITALLSALAPTPVAPAGSISYIAGDLARHDLETQRFNAEARLRRYGLGHIRVALSGRFGAPFSVSGGTSAQHATASKLLAE